MSDPPPAAIVAVPASGRSDRAQAFLTACQARGFRPGLDTMRGLLRALEHPERGCPVLLVAGTNGKGSVVAYVEAALRAGGLRSARFTSPALRRLEEQLVVDGAEVRSAELDAALAAVEDAAASTGLQPTAFEALTAAAWLHFRRRAVQVAVIEVGLGGAEDATNACEPLASAVVSVDLDHQEHLGPDLAAIAHAKCGVLRAGRPTVVGALPESARAVARARAAVLGARLVEAAEGSRCEPLGGRITLHTPRASYPGLRPLPGAHQRHNLLVAVRLLEVAAAEGLSWRPERLAVALDDLHWPARLQTWPGRPPLLIDGAHNPAGAAALAVHLGELGPLAGGPSVLLFGAMRDKDIAGMLAALLPHVEHCVLTRADRSARAASPAVLGGHLGSRQAHQEADLSAALALARGLAGPAGRVVVAGSLALAGAVLELLEGAG